MDSILPTIDTITVVNTEVNQVGTNTVMFVQDQPDLIGFWVGYFKKKSTDESNTKSHVYSIPPHEKCENGKRKKITEGVDREH